MNHQNTLTLFNNSTIEEKLSTFFFAVRGSYKNIKDNLVEVSKKYGSKKDAQIFKSLDDVKFTLEEIGHIELLPNNKKGATAVREFTIFELKAINAQNAKDILKDGAIENLTKAYEFSVIQTSEGYSSDKSLSVEVNTSCKVGKEYNLTEELQKQHLKI